MLPDYRIKKVILGQGIVDGGGEEMTKKCCLASVTLNDVWNAVLTQLSGSECV